MEDLVIGAVSNYNFEKLKCWINSLELTGYVGKKAIVCFNIKDDDIEKLKKCGFLVFLASNQRNSRNDGFLYDENLSFQVPLLRHYYYWKVLKYFNNIRYVISTDVSDVIFQTNPSEWLTNNMGDYKLNYGSEGLLYEDEDWGRDNILNCFGNDVYDYIKTTSIYNAGSMAGEFSTFVDFSLNVFFVANSAKHNPTPDQAAVNLVLSLEPYKNITKFNDHDINWSCQCGTTVDPTKIKKFRSSLLCKEPIFDGEYVYTSAGDKYCMVHQYNRVPYWNDILIKKYGDI